MTLLNLDIESIPYEKTAEYLVWDYNRIKEHKNPGVYVLFDCDGEVIYVGMAGTGDNKIDKRVRSHIRGTSDELKHPKNRYIKEIHIYEFPNTLEGKLDKDILEKWLIQLYRPLINKCYGETRAESIDYFGVHNSVLRWENWSNEDKQNLVDGGLSDYLYR